MSNETMPVTLEVGARRSYASNIDGAFCAELRWWLRKKGWQDVWIKTHAPREDGGYIETVLQPGVY